MDFLNPNRNDLEALPPVLKALLAAELAAGNEIAEISHGFPAPPCGACVKMKRTITTAPGEGLKERSWPAWDRSSGFTDEKGHFFITSPPEPEEPQLTMDEIRARVNIPSRPAAAPSLSSWRPEAEERTGNETPLRRFEASMVMDYDKWKEGIGYDLEALEAASPVEKQRIESKLLSQSPLDWRDVEALAALDTPAARGALQRVMQDGSAEERMAVTRYAPHLVTESSRVAALVSALQTAEFYAGLSQTLSEVQECHPPEVIKALLNGLLVREGGVAVHYAAMLFFLHGKAAEPFDWAHRPFFLRFHTEDPKERRAVHDELCAILDIDPDPVSASGHNR
ncbi:MAG TPA: hypothetical protein VHM91_00980 [Verrucomicrobiales bacterium]|nr:hypothetical protein [Verrucomicrobiales bacterium]